MIKKLLSTHSFAIAALAILMILPGRGWGANLISENIQSWTNHASYGSYTQSIAAGTVNMTQCIVANASPATGTCTAGRVQMSSSTGIIELPALATCGTAEFHMVAGASRTIKLQRYNGSSWDDLTTFSVTTTGSTFTYPVNSSSSTTLRLASPSGAVYVHDIIVTDYAAGTPTITVSSTTLTGFNYVAGAGPSTEQQFTISGANLTNDISIAASSNYEISKTSGSGYATPLTFTPAQVATAQTIYVRLKAGLSAANYNSEIITATSSGATNKTVTCSGSVTSPPPANDICSNAIALSIGAAAINGTLTNATPTSGSSFVYANTKNDVWYSFTASTTGSQTITINFASGPDIDFDVFTSTCPTTGTASVIAHGGNATSEFVTSTFNTGTTYYIRVIDYGSTSASTFTIGIAPPAPSITISTSALSGFNYSQGNGPSTEQTYTVSGANLTNAISIAATTNYEISLSTGTGYTSPLTLSPSSGSVATTTIYVRLKAGLTAGNYNSENVAASSLGATTQNVVCSGTVSAPLATLPLSEEFSYTVGTDLTANSWNLTGSNASPTVAVTASSISYPGYLSSGIGNEVTLATSGQDVNKNFASQLTGPVYASFLVNVTSANTGGDYFFVLGESTIGSTFRARIFVKKDASNNLAFGVSQSTSAANYTAFSYALNTTYLVAIKYDIVNGTSNDITSIYINPPLKAAIPGSGWVSNTDAAGADLNGIGSFGLRQGSSSSAAGLKLDGIRVSTNWADIVGAIPAPIITSFTPNNGCAGSNTPVTITGTNFTGATAVSINGTAVQSFSVTNATTISATTATSATGTGKISITTPGGTATSADDFTVNPNVTPTFTQLGPYIAGATPEALPGTSTNSITGTWNPATISTAAAGKTTYTFTPTAGQCATTTTMDITVTEGTKETVASGSWTDGTTWSGGTVPLATDNVTILHEVTLSGSGDCNKLDITTGSLTINSGASLITNGAVTGNATVKSYIDGNKWHLISSPVSGALSGTFSMKYLQSFSEADYKYSDIQLTTVELLPGQGFALWGDASGFTHDYVGPLNTGSVIIPGLTRTNISDADKSGWNLIGNPYPSVLDWNSVAKTNLNTAIYRANGSDWAIYNSGVGVPNSTSNQYIAPGQGFLVQVAVGTTGGSIIMDNSARVHNSATFFKKASVTNLARLQVSGNSYTDEAVVRFASDATSEFDGNYDAHKFFSEIPGSAQIYTLGSSPLAINALLPETTEVPLGIRANIAGTYTIAATQLLDMPSATLEDTQTGIFTDLSAGSYSFTAGPGEKEVRFILHFNTSVTSLTDPAKSLANIYSYQKTAFIDLKDQAKGNILIYNVSGQLIRTQAASKGMNEVKLPNTGIYMVKVITAKSTMVKKIWIE